MWRIVMLAAFLGCTAEQKVPEPVAAPKEDVDGRDKEKVTAFVRRMAVDPTGLKVTEFGPRKKFGETMWRRDVKFECEAVWRVGFNTVKREEMTVYLDLKGDVVKCVLAKSGVDWE